MFENLTNKFEEIFSSLKKAPSLNEKQVDEGLRKMRQALLEADVSLPVAKKLIENIRQVTDNGYVHSAGDAAARRGVAKWWCNTFLGEADETAPDAVLSFFDCYNRDSWLDAVAQLPGAYIPERHGRALPPIAKASDATLPARSLLITPNPQPAQLFPIAG